MSGFSDRDGILIHGGRQETNENGFWEAVDNPQLKATRGCLRALDTDVAKLREITENLMATDPKEEGGSLLLVPGLINVPAPAAVNQTDQYMGNGFYAIPGEGYEGYQLNSQQIRRVMNGQFFQLLQELRAEQAETAKKKEKK